MKRFALIITALIMIIVTSSVTLADEKKENESFKFRGYEWGTPLDDIKAKEITDDMIEGFDYEVRENNKVFILMTSISNVNLFAWFCFDDDWKLSYGYYSPQTALTKSDIEYYSDYETIDKALIGLYGEPERFATVLDADDVDNMSRDEIISKIVQDDAVIVHIWTANDESQIYSVCFFFGGHVRGEFYYVQSEEQFQEISASSAESNSEGL